MSGLYFHCTGPLQQQVPSPAWPVNGPCPSPSPFPPFSELLLSRLSEKALGFCFSPGPVLLAFCSCSSPEPNLNGRLLPGSDLCPPPHTPCTPHTQAFPSLSSTIRSDSFYAPCALDYIRALSIDIPNLAQTIVVISRFSLSVFSPANCVSATPPPTGPMAAIPPAYIAEPLSRACTVLRLLSTHRPDPAVSSHEALQSLSLATG